MIKIPKVEYKISLYPSKFLGYQSKNQDTGKITLYISSIWKWVHSWRWTSYFIEPEATEIMFDDFLNEFLYTMILERICLERAFQKIRMKKRCEEFNGFTCKMDYIATLICKNIE